MDWGLEVVSVLEGRKMVGLAALDPPYLASPQKRSWAANFDPGSVFALDFFSSAGMKMFLWAARSAEW
jgi:hypothetical protein